MKIIIFESKSKYNSLNFFINEIKKGFEELGHIVFVFDLLEKKSAAEKLSVITSFKPDFTFSFNCQIIFFNNTPVFDFLNIPHFAFLVDNPVHHFDFFQNINSSYLNISCVDKGHLEYCKYYYPNKKIHFLPHAAPLKNNGFIKKNNGTDIDFLFLGSVHSSEGLINNKMPENVLELIEILKMEIKTISGVSTFQVIQNVLRKNNILNLLNDRSFIKSLILILEEYIRTETRVELLKFFSSYNTLIYGDVSKDLKEIYSLFENKIFPSVNHDDLFYIIKQSKCVLNFHSIFANGTHERIFESLCCGVPVISTFSKYLKDEFEDCNSLMLFDMTDFNALKNHINAVTENYKSVIEPIEETREYILSNHTWKNRASEIVEIVTAG